MTLQTLTRHDKNKVYLDAEDRRVLAIKYCEIADNDRMYIMSCKSSATDNKIRINLKIFWKI